MNGGDGDGDNMDQGNLKGFYAYRDTFDEGNVWVEVPKQIQFVHVSDAQAKSAYVEMDDVVEPARQDRGSPVSAPAVDQLEPPMLNGQDMPGLHALSVAASVDLPLPLHQDISPTASIQDQLHGPIFPENAQLTEPTGLEQSDPSPFGSPPGDTFAADHGENAEMTANSTTAGFFASIDPEMPIAHANMTHPVIEERDNDREIAFLLRQFSECAGKWMDLFDNGSYFSSCVPVMARTNPLVRYAAVACAAKQLSRVKRPKPGFDSNGTRQVLGGYYDASSGADWACKGAKYKDKAVSLLLQALYKDPEVALLRDQDDALHRPGAGCNDLLLGTVILSMLECLDASGEAWAGHLNHAKWLVDIVEAGITPTPQRAMTHLASDHGRVSRSKGWRAAFWNLARQDLLYAFINEHQTRLDTEDIQIWRHAGIILGGEGFVQPSNQNPGDIMGEDMIGNAIIWLTSKIVSFVAAADGIYPCQGAGSSEQESSGLGVESRIGVNQKTLLERWREIEKELNVWHDGLPDTFQPSARLDPSPTFSDLDLTSKAYFPEIWYSNPICASTMQFYHMARILLLINKPHESTAGKSTVTSRLNSYRAIEMEIRKHSGEIVGISLSRPEASVRVHQVQPLFVAGQCLTGVQERKVVIDLLRGIEDELGWATEYRIKELLEDWG